MQTRCNALLVAALLAFHGVGAMAASNGDARLRMLEQRFHAADTNGDGKLSREEARQGMPRVYAYFDRIDQSGAGFVTLAQIESALGIAR